MPAGRSNRVLFDLIPQREAEPSRAKSPAPVAPTPVPSASSAGGPPGATPGKPVVRVELKPQDPPTHTSSTGTGATPPHASHQAMPSSAGSSAGSQGPSSRGAAYAARPETAHAAAVPAPEAVAPRAYQEIPRAAATPHARAASVRWPSFLGTSALPVPLNLIYLSVAALVILAVGFFIWGRAVGESSTMKQLGAGTLDVPPVVEPGGGVGGGTSSPQLLPPAPTTPKPSPTPSPAPGRTGPQGGRNQPQTPAPISTPAPAGAILTARGPVMTDPRVADLNYLSLASLGEADANAAIVFLAANGVDAIGVPRVDPGTPRANNQGPTQVYRIYALPGITRDEYAQKLTARTNLEAAVARIGATWQRDHRGPSNFARTMWEKYRP